MDRHLGRWRAAISCRHFNVNRPADVMPARSAVRPMPVIILVECPVLEARSTRQRHVVCVNLLLTWRKIVRHVMHPLTGRWLAVLRPWS